MQTSLIRRLLHPIKELISPRARRSSAETSESERESDMPLYNSIEEGAESIDAAAIEIHRETEYGESDEDTSAETCCDNTADRDADESDEGEAAPFPSAVTGGSRAHLTSSVPRAARVPRGVLTKGEMAEIRSIFGDMDDAEIQRLYKRVTK